MMTGRKILIFVVLVVGAMIAVIWSSGLGTATGPILISILLSVFFVIISVGTTTELYQDFIEAIGTKSSLKKTACRFYLYGRGGSGKTTLIKTWLGGEVRPEQSTKYFAHYISEKYIDLETKRRCRVI
ncbi:MAG: hypothetical protein F6K03_13290, partial [Kamptonema sp. SIO4C4]|nr:hypothetical protein [Kamptonema sp. SIO4C4]